MNRISACIITLNEERNLPRAIGSLHGVADEIVVVDAGSTDQTRTIASELGATVFSRPWTDYAEQRNFAAECAQNDWILALDADEELSSELQASLRRWKDESAEYDAFEFCRRSQCLGAWIRHSGWYPDRKTRLYHRRRARFSGMVHEAVRANGRIGRLRGDLFHYTAQTLAQQQRKSQAYSAMGAEELYKNGRRQWLLPAIVVPPWTLVQNLIFRAGWMDGWRGFLISWMAARTAYLKFCKLGECVRRGRRDPTE